MNDLQTTTYAPIETDSEPILPNLQEFTDGVFEEIVGQENPKRELGFYLDTYHDSRMVPHFGIIAPKGQGKTKLARAIAKGLFQFDEDGKPIFQPSKKDPTKLVPKRKPFIEVNCSTIKNAKQFFNGLIVQYVQDKDVTIFFDEASELPQDVEMALLTILENNATNKTQYAYEEYVFEFDFRRQTFIFATTEVQKVFAPLLDRLERISLQDYSHADLAQIIAKNLPGINVSEELLLAISPVLRGNARAAIKMAEKIKAYLRHNLDFLAEDWANLCKILTIRPLGLNDMEVQILRYLSVETKGVSLTGLSARTGMSVQALRQDCELYLLKYGLMEIQVGSGRLITPKGLNYLRVIDGKEPLSLSV